MEITFAPPLDVINEGAAHAAVLVAVDAFGRLDVVVNNAGCGASGLGATHVTHHVDNY